MSHAEKDVNDLDVKAQELKKKRREYYLKNQDKIKAKNQEYRRNNPEKVKAQKRDNYKRRGRYSPTRTREGRLMRRYGLTSDAFDSMLRGQGGVCAICRTDNWSVYGPFVDHDHNTGMVRGILCHKCNVAIGFLKENPEIISRAYDYVISGGVK